MGKFKLSDLNNKHFLALAGNGIIAVIGILTIGLLNRSLEKSDVGVYFFFLGIFTLADAFRYGFLSTATVKFYAGTSKERGDEVLGSVWYLAIMITAVLMAVDFGCLFFLNFIDNSAMVTSLRWFGITILSSLPLNVVFWILTADERYDKMLWLKLINSGSMVLTIIVFTLLHKMSLNALLWINMLTNCLASAAGMVWGLGRFRTIFKKSKETVREIIHFGKYSVSTTLMSKLFNSTDTFIITFMLGPAALAVYSLPVKLMEIIEFPLRSFLGTGMSAMAMAYNNNNKYHTAYILKKYAGMLTLGCIAMAAVTFVFADVAVSILGGSKYLGTESANIYRAFMILAIVYPIDRFTGIGLDIIHRPKLNFYKVMIMLAITVAGNFAGIAIFKNLYGIVFSSYIVMITGACFGYYHLKKYLDFSLSEILKSGYLETKLLVQKYLK